MTHRIRTGVPIPPSERPVKQRAAVRVVVRSGDEVLLLCDSDPGIPQVTWWVTPGGGIDPGETTLQAAVRELAEETGLQTSADELRGPIAHRYVTHGYSDQILRQEEWFYLLDVAKFDVRTDGHTPSEQVTLQGSRWWPVPDLRGVWTWPDMVELLAAVDRGEFVEYGHVEESVIAESAGYSSPADMTADPRSS